MARKTSNEKEPNRVPMFLPGQALQSLRDSGYSLPEALAEPIDNSLEADANHIAVRLYEARGPSGKSHIHRIAVSDDGTGMDTEILQHYLQLGYSTRYMRTDTIGKYGVGAKLAALSFARRIDVWSRTDANAAWQHVRLDLEEVIAQEARGEPIYVEPVDSDPLPDDMGQMLPTGAGTLVVWSSIDRLEEGRRAPDARSLRIEVEKELSRIFRHFLHGGISISVNDTALLPHDPLFVMEGTYADMVLAGESGRAVRSKSDGKQKPRTRGSDAHFAALPIAREEIPVTRGLSAKLTVTLHPKEVVRERGRGGDALARKLRVPENEGAISFVRLNREINYTNVPRIFPRGVEPADRFIGIEVAFSPKLDEYFGVRNVKRGVEPHNELRAELRKRLRKYVTEARNKLEEIWGEAQRASAEHKGEHAAIVEAVKDANRVLPKGRAKGARDESEQAQILDDLARDVMGDDDQAKQDYLSRIKNLPFVVESVDFPGTVFIDVQHLDGQVIIRLNTRHRFYREMWEPIKSIAERTAGEVTGDEAVRVARRTIEALSLLLVSYGKAESMHENPRDQYGDLRMFWGQFCDSLMGRVAGAM